MNSTQILGVQFSKLTLPETIELLDIKIEENSAELYHVITANPEIVIEINKDEELKQIAREADLITADGIGIIYASRLLREPITERVTGYDLLIELLKLGEEKELSFYFFGAEEKVNRDVVDFVAQHYPKVRIVGRHNGFFTANEEVEIIEEINAGRPDVLIIALGSPLADKWLYKHKKQLKVKVALGVGGALDVLSGHVKRAPILWQRLNLEWLHRLILHPKRWRRQLKLPVFAVRAIREAIRVGRLG